MTWSQNQPHCLKSGKVYISIHKITENVGNFRTKVQNFGKMDHVVLLLAKTSKAGCLFRSNFLKQVVIEIQKMEPPSSKIFKVPPRV